MLEVFRCTWNFVRIIAYPFPVRQWLPAFFDPKKDCPSPAIPMAFCPVPRQNYFIAFLFAPVSCDRVCDEDPVLFPKLDSVSRD